MDKLPFPQLVLIAGFLTNQQYYQKCPGSQANQKKNSSLELLMK